MNLKNGLKTKNLNILSMKGNVLFMIHLKLTNKVLKNEIKKYGSIDIINVRINNTDIEKPYL